MSDYRTPGVYVEEISTGPRPIQRSPTGDTGFVAVLTLPREYHAGQRDALGLPLPAREDQVALSWSRALAFLPLTRSTEAPPPKEEAGPEKAEKAEKPPKEKASSTRATESRLARLVSENLSKDWKILPAGGPGQAGSAELRLRSQAGQILLLPARRTLLNRVDGQWDLATGADEARFLELLASHAIPNGIPHSGLLPGIAAEKPSLDLKPGEGRLLQGPAAAGMTSFEGFAQWRGEIARQLFISILSKMEGLPLPQAEARWSALERPAREAWIRWFRRHPGMTRLELAISGFFENGGKKAYIALMVQEHRAPSENRRAFLKGAFDGISDLAMLVAPGLDYGWQQAILEYAGPRGRGDLFAVIEAPRHLLSEAPPALRVREVGSGAEEAPRWCEGGSPYEVEILQTTDRTEAGELRYLQYDQDVVLDRAVPRDDGGYGAAYAPWLVVDNPLSTGEHDRYVLAPPGGHVAGMIAATDSRPGAGVHKAPANELVVGLRGLATSISDGEQGSLNAKGINIIRHRPGAGIRVWGARTLASDPLWNYVSVRRLFLMVERSVRQAIQWAVFMPNTEQTRSDLKSTIAAFLYQLHRQGMLDGRTPEEAYVVQCDRENNPDPEVRAGILTVDVALRPVYPAEFIRLRFRQSSMLTELVEG